MSEVCRQDRVAVTRFYDGERRMADGRRKLGEPMRRWGSLNRGGEPMA